MRKLFQASFAYLIAGLLGGLFYREFTKVNDFPEGGATQLAVVHTHLLTLGVIVLLIVLVLEKVFVLSNSKKLFTWFFWTYNAGVILSSAMMLWHGSLTVTGSESSAMISGIAGLGHMLLTAGFILLFVMLGRAIKTPQQPTDREAALTA